MDISVRGIPIAKRCCDNTSAYTSHFKGDRDGKSAKTSAGDSRIKRVLDRLATLSIPTVRVEALEYS